MTRSLLKTIRLISTSLDEPLRPTEIVSAMSSNRRVINREQQDAQELFQLISGELDNENQLAHKKQGGFRDLLNMKSSSSLFSLKPKTLKSTSIDNPFTGLLANRLSCTECGYTVSYCSVICIVKVLYLIFIVYYYRKQLDTFPSTMFNFHSLFL